MEDWYHMSMVLSNETHIKIEQQQSIPHSLNQSSLFAQNGIKGAGYEACDSWAGNVMEPQ